MIQRRQTIFMLLTTILSALLFFTPFASFHNENAIIEFSIWGVSNPIESLTLSNPSTWPLIVLAALMTILPLYTIFIYKKRERQVKLCKLNMLLNVVLIALVFVYFESDIQMIINAIENDTVLMNSYYWGMAIPVVNLLLEIFAIRGIKKDIELLKSVDRLR